MNREEQFARAKENRHLTLHTAKSQYYIHKKKCLFKKKVKNLTWTQGEISVCPFIKISTFFLSLNATVLGWMKTFPTISCSSWPWLYFFSISTALLSYGHELSTLLDKQQHTQMTVTSVSSGDPPPPVLYTYIDDVHLQFILILDPLKQHRSSLVHNHYRQTTHSFQNLQRKPCLFDSLHFWTKCGVNDVQSRTAHAATDV